MYDFNDRLDPKKKKKQIFHNFVTGTETKTLKI